MQTVADALPLWDPAARRVTSVRRRPRSYQTAGIAAYEASRLPAPAGSLFVLFTGGGKTFIAGDIAKREEGRVLFVVNRTTLGRQSLTKLQEDTGKAWELEQADSWASVNGKANVVTLIQTLQQPKRFERFAPDAFSLIIVDEVHRFMAPSRRRPLEYFTGARKLGLTATPDGTKGYKPLFETVAFHMPLADAIEQAWSTPIDFQPYACDVSLDSVKWKGGDFTPGELDKILAQAAAPIATAAIEKCGDLRTLVYCPGVKTAIATTDAINERRPGSARVIYGVQDAAEGKGTNAANIAAHKRGWFQYLVSVAMIGEGYDDENVGCILLARPMGKRADFEQAVGRGTRLYPGLGDIEDMEARRAAIAASPKPTCLVVDLACVSLKHELVGPVDILGGNYTEQEKKEAKKSLEKAGGGDPMEALKAAREELARRAMRAAAAKEAKVKLRAIKKPEEPQRLTNAGEYALTSGQERKLAEYKIPFDANTTKNEAQKLIGFEKLCEKNGWCRYHQREFLGVQCGVENSRAWPVEKGKRVADAWKAGGKLRLTAEQIRRAIEGK